MNEHDGRDAHEEPAAPGGSREAATQTGGGGAAPATGAPDAAERPPPPGHRDAPRFVPPVTSGYVIRVYDGDTVTVAAPVFRTTYEFSVRVRGVDCLFLRAKTLRTRDPDEKHVAVIARDAVRAVVLGRWVDLTDVATDKYGRLLATVTTPEGVDVTEMLIERRLAVPYGGKTKNAPENWRAFHEQQPEPGSHS